MITTYRTELQTKTSYLRRTKIELLTICCSSGLSKGPEDRNGIITLEYISGILANTDGVLGIITLVFAQDITEADQLFNSMLGSQYLFLKDYVRASLRDYYHTYALSLRDPVVLNVIMIRIRLNVH